MTKGSRVSTSGQWVGLPTSHGGKRSMMSPMTPSGDHDCVKMTSASWDGGKWMSVPCDDFSAKMPVRKLPMRG